MQLGLYDVDDVTFWNVESPNSTYLYLLLVPLIKSKPLEGPGYRVMASFYSDRDDQPLD